MPRIVLETRIAAPIERCFDLARSIDLHVATQTRHGEVAIAGVTSGLIGLGQEVTWRARHFLVTQTLSTRIVAFDRPRHFRDSMLRGAFRRFDHDHDFAAVEGGTVMKDTFDFASPLGPLGWIADRVALEGYMTRFLAERAAILKRVAESEEWRRFL